MLLTILLALLLKNLRMFFSEKLDTYKGPLISLPIGPKVNPIRFKARNFSLAMLNKVNELKIVG